MYPIRNLSSIVIASLDEEVLLKQALRLSSKEMRSEDTVFLMKRLSFIPLEEREHLITLILQIIEAMSANDIGFIINRLSFVSVEEREEFISHALCLINDTMIPEDRMYIISKLSFMSPPERELLINQVLSLIKEETSNRDKTAIIQGKIRQLQRKYRFRIHSRELKENPIKIVLDIFETLRRDSIKLTIYSIQFIDSPVIDDGGVLRSFIAALMQSLCRPKYPFIIETGLGVVPTVDPHDSFLSLEDQEKCLKVIGRIFSAALKKHNSIVIGKLFHPIVFEMIFHLTEEDLTTENPCVVFDKMLKIWLLQEGGVEEKTAINLIQNTIIQELKQVYCIDSRDEFIKMYGLDGKIKATFIIAKSLYDSLPEKIEWKTIKGELAIDLEEKIQGVISLDNVLNAISLDTLDKPEQTSVQYVKKWISEADSEMLKKLVEAITGIKTLSSSMQLNITGMSGLDKLPRFYICFFRIEVSKYKNYKVFKEKLELSLDYCFTDTGFQMP